MNENNYFLILILAGLGYCLIVWEYFALGWYPEWISYIPAKLLEKAPPLLQIAKVASPTFLVLAFVLRGYENPDDSDTRKLTWKWQIIIWIVFILSFLVVLQEKRLTDYAWLYFYPIAIFSSIITSPIIGNQPNSSIINPPLRKSKLGFHFPLKTGILIPKGINISNPFRGIFICGSAGSGKSESFAKPILWQAAQKSYTGILYDYKFPELTNVAYSAYHLCPDEVTFYLINFTDLSRSYRVNPLHPRYLPSIAYADELAQAIVSNLMPETISKKDFWVRSAVAILTATIWYMRKHHPEDCNLPHIVKTICSKDFENHIKRLEKDPETASLVSSVSVALERDANKQLAGVSSTLQIALAKLDTPEINWVMSGDEVDLKLNDPDHKSFLVVGTDPKLSDHLSPVISCIITCALKQINQPDRHHSLVLLDEGPTLFIPKFEQIPATARSHQIATIFMAQDISQLVQSYGQTNAEVILANLNSQLFGRTSNPRTAEYVSSLFGLEERKMKSTNQNKGTSYQRSIWGFPIPHYGKSVSVNLQQRPIIKPQEIMELKTGEFIGITVSKINEKINGKCNINHHSYKHIFNDALIFNF